MSLTSATSEWVQLAGKCLLKWLWLVFRASERQLAYFKYPLLGLGEERGQDQNAYETGQPFIAADSIGPDSVQRTSVAVTLNGKELGPDQRERP
jgi:hypothetical protein